jgi:thiol-disulfide isomerase/thioredoxin
MKKLPILFILILFGFKIFAQQKTTTPALALKAKIEQFPDSLPLHEKYLNLSYKDNNLESQYQIWTKKFPKSAIVPFAIGKNLFSNSEPSCEYFLMEAVKRNPNLAEAYYLLSINAQRKQNLEEEINYSKKAEIADKTNGKYAFSAAYVYFEKDKEYADSVMLEVARKFKHNEFGAKALFFLAYQENNLTIKKAYLTQLFEIYKNNPSEIYNSGMSSLFSLFINQEDYEAAYKVALQVAITNDTNRLNWKHLQKTARQFLMVKDLINNNQPDSALKIIDDIKLINSFTTSYIYAGNTLFLLKIKCLIAAGKEELAYQTLLENYSKSPSKKVYQILESTAKTLQKTPEQVDENIKTERYKNIEMATNLTRINLLDSTKVSISDFKGKVVLLSLWYPSCSPCRAEMPHLENVLKNFDRNEVVYLTINVLPKEDGLIKGILEKTGYTFIPLNDDFYGNKGNLSTSGYPTNFLLDKEGNIITKSFYARNQSEEESLELMIKDILKY